jgi:hypothetical protein
VSENTDAEMGLPKNKQDLLAIIDTEWALLNDLISGIDTDQMEIPKFGGWSVKDILAHITAWEQFMDLHYLQNQPAHEAFGLASDEFDSLEEDGYNAILYERHRHRQLAQIHAEFHECHVDVVSRLQNMSFKAMSEPLLIGIAANTYEHYKEHRESIEALVGSDG